MAARNRNHIDFVLLIAVLTLMLLSVGIVYSASASFAMRHFKDSEYMLVNHSLKVFLAVVFLFITIRIDYHNLERFSKIALLGAAVLLAVTLVVGAVSKGATRWLGFGILNIQPSEFAKYALLFHLCILISLKGDAVADLKKGFIPLMVWIVLITALVMLQPNFSMGAMIFMLGIMIVFTGGVKLKHILAAGAVLIPVIVLFMLIEPYRVSRLEQYLAKPDSSGQLNQAICALGNGSVFGVGPGDSTQRDFYLPESYGDFVFAILGEEYGFVGTVFFMLLFFLIMLRGFRIAKAAPDVFGRYLALSITFAITMYALVHAGVNVGILPTTGLPMPFISYGGSSMVFSACAVGVLLNISSQTSLNPRVQRVPVVGSINADSAPGGKVY